MKKYKIRKTFTFDGKRYSAYGDSEKEALLRMFEKKKALEEGKVTVSGSMTVSEWTEIAISTYKQNVSPEVMKDMMMRIRKHILSAIGYRALRSVKPLDCQAIMNKCSGMSFSHIQKLTQELRFIFSTAVQNKLILENPAQYITIPKAVKGKRQSLTEDERKVFLQTCEGTDRFRVFQLMYYCGCRPAEAIGCEGRDLGVMDGVSILHIRGTKTVNADRIVPIPEDFYDLIKDTPSDEPLAPNDRGRHHSESSYNRAVSSLRREMNILLGCRVYRNQLIPPFPLRESFVPYDLRHTFCTDLARKGVDIRIAQKLMGHSSINITSDIYTHVDSQQILSEAIKILGKNVK
jgi:integrase